MPQARCYDRSYDPPVGNGDVLFRTNPITRPAQRDAKTSEPDYSELRMDDRLETLREGKAGCCFEGEEAKASLPPPCRCRRR